MPHRRPLELRRTELTPYDISMAVRAQGRFNRCAEAGKRIDTRPAPLHADNVGVIHPRLRSLLAPVPNSEQRSLHRSLEPHSVLTVTAPVLGVVIAQREAAHSKDKMA